MKDTSGNWIEFLDWYSDYIDAPSYAKVQLSREDMRYAYQAGYEKAYKEINGDEVVK